MPGLRRSSLAVLAVGAAALAAGLLAACGSSSGSGDDPQHVLEQTFQSSKSLQSGKLDIGVSVLAAGDQGFTLDLAGPFQRNGDGKLPSFALQAAITQGGRSLTASLTSTGTALYIGIGGAQYQASPKQFAQFRSGFEQAQSQDSATAAKGGSLSALGVQPLHWIVAPRAAGPVDVGGTDTLHITAAVRVPELVADVNKLLGTAGTAGIAGQAVPKQLSPAELTRTSRMLRHVTVDVFTGKDDKVLRRMVVSTGLRLAPGQTVGGIAPSGLRLSVTFTDLGRPQTITAPPGAKPLSELTPQLQGLMGGLGGGSGPSGPGRTSG